jgi:DNA ligase (NAD+)
MNNSPKDRLNILKEQIAEFSYEYHVLDKPSQSDAVYDGLMTELKDIESKHPELVTSDSPSQRVGNEVSKGFSSVNHVSRMLSLNDVFSEDDVTAWIARMQKLMPSQKNFSFYADVKKDGLACSLIYIDGVFKQAVTRGDGFKGEDVTDNVRTISSVPLRLRNVKETNKFLAGRLEVRGEIVMYKKDFTALNEQREKSGMELFANPRNTAAGTIRQLDSKLVAARKLHFLAYDILPENTRDISTHHEVYELLSSLSFKGAEYGAQLSDATAISEYIHKWSQKRESLPYEIDGLVIKIDQRDLYDKAGIVGKNPRAAVAFKFPAEQSTTIVKDIFVSIGRTGAATPVAILAPVKIAGRTVQMA